MKRASGKLRRRNWLTSQIQQENEEDDGGDAPAPGTSSAGLFTPSDFGAPAAEQEGAAPVFGGFKFAAFGAQQPEREQGGRGKAPSRIARTVEVLSHSCWIVDASCEIG